MKILYLMSGAGLSGAEICLLRLTTEIIQNSENTVAILNTEEGILNENFRSLGLKVYIQPSIYVKKIYRVNEIIQLFKNIFAFRKIIKLEKPDIIHAFTLPLARRVILFKKINIKAPIVGSIHDELTAENFGTRKAKRFTKSINENYEKLISVSAATSQVAVENGVNKNKIMVIHNGIPQKNKTMPKAKAANFVIGNFGRIVFNKGQHVIIEAVNILKDKIPELKCFIIGKPPLGVSGSIIYYESLKRKVIEYGIEKNIEFIEWLDGLDEYYDKLNIYILSSVAHDPFPTVNLEAMMFQKPVIATSAGGSKEQIIDGITGFIIEPGNPILLAEKIQFLYQHPDKANEMGGIGYKRVTEEFTMQKYAQQHLTLYDDIIYNSHH